MAFDLSNIIPTDKHIARLFYLRRSNRFDFGFQIYTFNNGSKQGHFVGRVLNNLCSEMAGLPEGDRIIALNNVDVSGKTKNEVIKAFRSQNTNTLRLLVTDPKINYLSSHGLLITCNIKRKVKTDEYGFSLITRRSKPGHFIGPIKSMSLAEAAGLQKGLRLIEVNGVDIIDESHKLVAKHIVENSLEVMLTLIRPAIVAVANDFYQPSKITKRLKSMINMETFVMAESMMSLFQLGGQEDGDEERIKDTD